MDISTIGVDISTIWVDISTFGVDITTIHIYFTMLKPCADAGNRTPAARLRGERVSHYTVAAVIDSVLEQSLY